jgi:iron(III) transport system substrate-binding protein
MRTPASAKGIDSMTATLPRLAPVVIAIALGASTPALAQSGEVNVYTYRESKLIQPLFDAFTKDTGIKVNVISASSGLEQRIKTEGTNSPADVLLTVDIGRLEDAVRAGITQPIKSKVLDEIVPAQYRDPEGHWYGVSMRGSPPISPSTEPRRPRNGCEG